MFNIQEEKNILEQLKKKRMLLEQQNIADMERISELIIDKVFYDVEFFESKMERFLFDISASILKDDWRFSNHKVCLKCDIYDLTVMINALEVHFYIHKDDTLLGVLTYSKENKQNHRDNLYISASRDFITSQDASYYERIPEFIEGLRSMVDFFDKLLVSIEDEFEKNIDTEILEIQSTLDKKQELLDMKKEEHAKRMSYYTTLF